MPAEWGICGHVVCSAKLYLIDKPMNFLAHPVFIHGKQYSSMENLKLDIYLEL